MTLFPKHYLFACAAGGLLCAHALAQVHSPCELAFSPDGRHLAVTDRTTAVLHILDTATGRRARTITLDHPAMDVAWNGPSLWVTDYETSRVLVIDAWDGRIRRRHDTVTRPMGIAVTKSGTAVVSGYGRHEVAVMDAQGNRRVTSSGRFPYFVALTSNGKTAVVGNLLPDGAGTDADAASRICLLDVSGAAQRREIALPYGSSNVRGIAVTPDDRWALVAHTRGRVNLPTSQLERGWVNTNALSVIDLEKQQLHVTLLLDTVQRGGADPWGVAVSPDGRAVWVTLAGVHEMARLDFGLLLEYLRGRVLPRHLKPSDAKAVLAWDVWEAIRQEPLQRQRLENELSALYAAKLLTRVGIPCRGPRGMAVSPDGKRLAVAGYFSGNVVLMDAETMHVEHDIPLAESRPLTPVRLGEMLFHDATQCFQQWLSCATCHPDGRADGLNWDLLNDGIGNPKNTKSLVLSHATPPAMSTGVRATFDAAVEAGFKHILMRVPNPEDVEAVKAYLRSLQPEPSPHLEQGRLSLLAQQGRTLFNDAQVGCASCHTGDYYTDLGTMDVGTRGPLDRTDAFDNPTLREVWRTAPYLHHGAGATLESVLREHNPKDRHGKTSPLTDHEIDALVAYLLSL
jgi:DNA-binding beta-propeller fold protein YncE